jgi:outer membrane protein assembly factor BamD (BamD/ComL family)
MNIEKWFKRYPSRDGDSFLKCLAARREYEIARVEYREAICKYREMCASYPIHPLVKQRHAAILEEALETLYDDDASDKVPQILRKAFAIMQDELRKL